VNWQIQFSDPTNCGRSGIAADNDQFCNFTNKTVKQITSITLIAIVEMVCQRCRLKEVSKNCKNTKTGGFGFSSSAFPMTKICCNY